MRFEWDEEKNRSNIQKHDLGFETAVLVFDDPYALTQRDPFYGDEERWMTLGTIEAGALLFVVHTWFDRDGEEVVRIISARRATPAERSRYEEVKQGTKTGHHRHRRKERRRH